MSLEQALADNTAALIRLATVMATGAESAPVAAAPKARKAAAATPVASSDYPANEGDPAGTRYFHVPNHNTVYKQVPGAADCTLNGSLIVSGAEYLIQKAELEKKFPTASVAATPTPVTTVPTVEAPAAASATTFEQVVDKMRELHKAQGNPGVQSVLTKFCVAAVPALKGKATNDELIAAIDSTLMGL